MNKLKWIGSLTDDFDLHFVDSTGWFRIKCTLDNEFLLYDDDKFVERFDNIVKAVEHAELILEFGRLV